MNNTELCKLYSCTMYIGTLDSTQKNELMRQLVTMFEVLQRTHFLSILAMQCSIVCDEAR